jgi:hypothetical protein
MSLLKTQMVVIVGTRDLHIHETKETAFSHFNGGSQMLDDLLSPTQRAILDVVYRRNPQDRTKYKVVFCDKAEPVLKAASYMDQGEYENELKQVIGILKSPKFCKPL